jgi:hypothetical protein
VGWAQTGGGVEVEEDEVKGATVVRVRVLLNEAEDCDEWAGGGGRCLAEVLEGAVAVNFAVDRCEGVVSDGPLSSHSRQSTDESLHVEAALQVDVEMVHLRLHLHPFSLPLCP